MSETLIHNARAYSLTEPQGGDARKAEAPVAGAAPNDDVPIGYRRVSRRWRALPDGTRDYALFHGKTTFDFLLPVSSRLRTPKR